MPMQQRCYWLGSTRCVFVYFIAEMLKDMCKDGFVQFGFSRRWRVWESHVRVCMCVSEPVLSFKDLVSGATFVSVKLCQRQVRAVNWGLHNIPLTNLLSLRFSFLRLVYVCLHRGAFVFFLLQTSVLYVNVFPH